MTKKRIFEILEPAGEGDLASKIFDVSIVWYGDYYPITVVGKYAVLLSLRLKS